MSTPYGFIKGKGKKGNGKGNDEQTGPPLTPSTGQFVELLHQVELLHAEFDLLTTAELAAADDLIAATGAAAAAAARLSVYMIANLKGKGKGKDKDKSKGKKSNDTSPSDLPTTSSEALAQQVGPDLEWTLGMGRGSAPHGP